MCAMPNPYLKLIDALYEKYNAREAAELRECLNREIAERGHRYDIVGQSLYAFCLYAIDADLRMLPSAIGDLFTTVNGELAALEDITRSILKKDYSSFLSEPMPAFVKEIDDVDALDEFEKKVHQKNLVVMKKVLDDIKAPEAREDSAYEAALEFLKSGGVADFLRSFKHLIYLVNIYNVIIPDADLADLMAGRDDFVMMAGLSDTALDFLENLDG